MALLVALILWPTTAAAAGAVSPARDAAESSGALGGVVEAPLCSPIEAVAAIYRMPGHGVAWPQQRVETTGFTLSAAGVTEIVFTKTSEPVQFDVLTGATPATISPWGPWHGPLLFPFDPATSQQWWGRNAPDPVVPEAPLVPALAVVGVIASVGVVSMRRRAGRPATL